MHKRGQATVLMLLGVALVILVFLFYVIVGLEFDSPELSFDSESISAYITACLDQTAYDALTLLGKQGGTIILQEYISAPSYGISYGQKEGIVTLPTKSHMQRQLEFYITQHINSCFNGFEDFTKLGWKTTAGDIKPSVSVNRQDVRFTLTLPLTVTYEEQSIMVSQFSTVIPSSLHSLHEAAQRITAEFSPTTIDLHTLEQTGFNATIFPYKDTVVVRLHDFQSQFQFAIG